MCQNGCEGQYECFEVMLNDASTDLAAPVKMPAMPSGKAPPLLLLKTLSIVCLSAETTPIQDIICRTTGKCSITVAANEYILVGMPASAPRHHQVQIVLLCWAVLCTEVKCNMPSHAFLGCAQLCCTDNSSTERLASWQYRDIKDACPYTSSGMF